MDEVRQKSGPRQRKGRGFSSMMARLRAGLKNPISGRWAAYEGALEGKRLQCRLKTVHASVARTPRPGHDRGRRRQCQGWQQAQIAMPGIPLGRSVAAGRGSLACCAQATPLPAARFMGQGRGRRHQGRAQGQQAQDKAPSGTCQPPHGRALISIINNLESFCEEDKSLYLSR